MPEGQPAPPYALERATLADAPAIAALQTAVAEDLTARFGSGHWSAKVTERGVLAAARSARILVLRQDGEILATLRLATKKPWAIDRSYFTACKTSLYLTDMAVRPGLQRRGLGRLCLEETRRLAREWPADALRLDAYDHPAGAGEFYRKCGYREVGRVVYRTVPLIYFELLV